MIDELKSFNEIRADLQRLGIARFYYQAVKRTLLFMFDCGVLPKKEPKIEYNNPPKIHKRTLQNFELYHFFKQMLNDNRLIDAFLLEDGIIAKYGTRIEKGKAYRTVKFYPESATKTFRVFLDEEE